MYILYIINSSISNNILIYYSRNISKTYISELCHHFFSSMNFKHFNDYFKYVTVHIQYIDNNKEVFL